MKPIQFFLYSAFFASLGCGQTAKPPFTEKRIVIGNKETIEIKEIDLSISNEGCGRKWISEGDKPSYERPFCSLQGTYKKEKFFAGEDFDTINVQDLLLKVERMNPWGREEDSIPPGGCRIWVKINK